MIFIYHNIPKANVVLVHGAVLERRCPSPVNPVELLSRAVGQFYNDRAHSND